MQLLPCCLPWWKAQETIGRSAPRNLEAFFVLKGRWSDLVLPDFVWNLRESISITKPNVIFGRWTVDDILSDRKHVQLRTVGGSVLMVLAWSSDPITNTACHCCYGRCIPGFLRFRTSRIKICSIKTYQPHQPYQACHQFVWDPMIPSFIVKTSLLPRREDVALARWLFSSTISPSNGSTRRFSREGAEDVNVLLSEYVVNTSDVSSQVFFEKGFGKAARLRNRLNRSEISQTCVSSCGFYASIPSTFCPFFSDFPGSRGGLLYVQMVHQDRENITSTGLAAFGGLSFVISGKDDACHPLRATWWMHLNSGKVPKRLQSDLTSVEGFHHVWWFDTQVEGLLGETPGWRCFRTFADLQRS